MGDAVIRNSPLFSGLSENQLQDALTFFSASRKRYQKGDFLHFPHQRLSRFGLVLSGCVQVSLDDMDGRTYIFANVESGGMFGESLCFLGQDANISIRALTACEILWLSTDAIQAEKPKNTLETRLTNRFIALLARRALSMNDRVQILSRSPLRERIKMLLAQYAQQYGPEFTLPFNREDLSLYLGANRSALSRELSAMRKEGLITYNRNHFILHKKEDFS